ncbi:LOW QUALITY PROTEIN: Zinc finger FYVE domain-containing protein 26 homolog, partial [Gryllus bimaculatus]
MSKFAVTFTSSCTELGLWYLVESCKSFKDKLVEWEPDFTVFGSRLWRSSPVVKYQWQELWLEMTTVAHVYRILKTKPEKIADMNTQKQVAEFQWLLQFISKKHPDLAEELWQLFVWRVCAGQQTICLLTEKLLEVLSDFLCHDAVCAHSLISYIIPKSSQPNATSDQLMDLYIGVLKECSCTAALFHSKSTEIGSRYQHMELTHAKNMFLSILSLMCLENNEEKLGNWLYEYLQSADNLIVSQKLMYFSLISQTHLGLLQYIFRLKERNQFIKWGGQCLVVPKDWLSANIKENSLFHSTVKNRVHCAEILLEVALSLLAQEEDQEVQVLSGWPHALKLLLPLLLPQLWTRATAGVQLTHWLQLLGCICKGIDCDPVLRHLGNILEQQVQLLEWCSAHTHNCSMSGGEILHISASSSTLKTLWLATDLSVANWSEIKQLLHGRQQQVCKWGEQQSDISTPGCSWDVTLFDGFCILISCFEAIHLAMILEKNGCLENQMFKYNSTETNEKDIKETADTSTHNPYAEILSKLQNVQDAVCSLFPLDFRIEVMEDLFSLLFLKQDCREENSDSDTSLEEGAVEEGLPDIETGLESSIASSVTSFINVSEPSDSKIKNTKAFETSTLDEYELLSSGNMEDDPSAFSSTQVKSEQYSQEDVGETSHETASKVLCENEDDIKNDSFIDSSVKISQCSRMHLPRLQREGQIEDLHTALSPPSAKGSGSPDKYLLHTALGAGMFRARGKQLFVCSQKLVNTLLNVLSECLVNTKAALYQQQKNTSITVPDSLMHQMSSTTVSDIAFTASLIRMRARLRSTVPEGSRRVCVKQVATEGAFIAWVTKEVGFFLSSTPLANLPEAPEVMAEFPVCENVLGVSQSSSTLALWDVLLTASSTNEHSVALLGLLEQCTEIAGRLGNLPPPSLSKGQTLGTGPYIQALVESFRLVNKDTTDGGFSSRISVCNLLHSHLYPLLWRGLKDQLQFWRVLATKAESWRELVCEDSESSWDVYWFKLLQSDILRDFVKLCASLNVSAGFISPAEEICGKENYVDKLLFYITFLSACLSEERAQCATECMSERVLGSSLREHLGGLALQLDLQPERETSVLAHARLEAIAHLVHHNLVLSMASIVWPKTLQATAGGPVSAVSPRESASGSRIVLNHQLESWMGPVELPNQAVAGLLDHLLAALEALAGGENFLDKAKASQVVSNRLVQWVLNQTACLSLVDLSLLQPGPETVAFYANLANLVWLHSLLVLETGKAGFGLLSSCDLRRSISQCSVGYIIGQKEQTFISLYNLQNTLCRIPSKWPYLWNSQKRLPSVSKQDPRLAFVLACGHQYTPRIQVLNQDDLENQLNTAAAEYLMSQVENSNEPIQLPQTFAPWREVTAPIVSSDFFLFSGKEHEIFEIMKLKSHCYAANTKDGMSLLHLSNEEEKETITKLIETDESESIEFISKFLQTLWDGAEFSNVSYKFTIKLKGCPQKVPKSKEDDLLSKDDNCNITEGALHFVESHCWLLAIILSRLLQESKKDNLTDTTEQLLAKWAHVTKHLRRLLVSRPVAALREAFEGSPVMCALQLPFAVDRVTPEVAHLLECGREQEAVEVVWMLPERAVYDHPGMSVLRDMLLFPTASSSECKGSIQPWKQCLLLENKNMAVSCVLDHLGDWPLPACQRVLQALLGEWSQPVPAALRVVLQQRLLHIQVQGKVSVSWAEQHPHVTPQNFQVNVEFILLLLELENYDFAVIEQLLLSLPPRKAFTICEELLSQLESINCKKSVVAFVVDVLHETLSQEEMARFTVMALGVRMLDFLTPNLHEAFWDLVCEPQLILEQLLMNSQFLVLEQIISSLRHTLSQLPPSSPLNPDKIDALLRDYAAQALECRVSRPDFLGVELTPPGSGRESSLSQSVMISKEGKGTSGELEDGQVSMESDAEEFVMPKKVPAKGDWMPDNKASECLCCRAVTFSMFNRRHHCRRCGRLVCAGCSAGRMQVEGYGQVAVRVCDACVRQTAKAGAGPGAGSSPPDAAAEAADGDHPDAQDAAADAAAAAAAATLQWRLACDAAHNATVRGEFAYARAPSVALCLAALAAHSEGAACPRFLVGASATLLQLLAPVGPGAAPNPEVDAALVLRMARSLLVAAKLKYARLGLATGEAHCDGLLQRADLLALLACAALAPCAMLSAPASPSPPPRAPPAPAARPPCACATCGARLLNAGALAAAVEGVHQGRLDGGRRWAAWGRACAARDAGAPPADKFCALACPALVVARPRPAPGPRPKRARLRPRTGPAAADLAHALLRRPPAAAPPPSPVPAQLAGTAKADRCCARFGAGEEVERAGEWRRHPPPPPPRRFPGPRARPPECLSLARRRRALASWPGAGRPAVAAAALAAARAYVRDAHVDPDTFVDALYLRCLREGRTAALHAALRDADPSLACWQAYLQRACAALARRGLLHALYRLQLFCGDLVRASMSCVRFYAAGGRSFGDLARAAPHLAAAERHLQAHLEAQLAPQLTLQASTVPAGAGAGTAGGAAAPGPGPLQLDARQVDAHIRTVRRQGEVARFLNACEARGARPMALVRELWPAASAAVHTQAHAHAAAPPTLFGSARERVQLAALAILCGRDVEEGFGIAF